MASTKVEDGAPMQMNVKGYIDYSSSINTATTERFSIVVKHFPAEITEQTMKEFFEHYGGGPTVEIKPWRARGMVFVKFQHSVSAERAQKQLNKKKVLDTTLIVEFAKDEQERQTEKSKKNEKATTSHFEPDPIAKSLGIDYGPPPHLEYAYPPPNPHILQNIYNAIASVPKLYIEVLHLMNKMNLPPPFGSPLPIFQDQKPLIAPDVISVQQKQKKKPKKPKKDDEESEESEIESEQEEEDKNKSLVDLLDQAKKGQLPEDMVDTYVTYPHEPTPMAMDQPGMMPPGIMPNFPGMMIPTYAPSMPARNIISLDALHANKLSMKDFLQLSVFKDKGYEAGAPTAILFVRNLHKDVTQEDLEYLFGRYFDTDEAMKEGLNINILTGRMKGQAFITFPSVELAQHGLEDINGYILKEKPLVIQFRQKK